MSDPKPALALAKYVCAGRTLECCYSWAFQVPTENLTLMQLDQLNTAEGLVGIGSVACISKQSKKYTEVPIVYRTCPLTPPYTTLHHLTPPYTTCLLL